jgi:predicted metal-dependent hydrolase
MPILLYREHQIPYILKPSRRRRTLALQVNGQHEVTVFAPHHLPGFSIDRFLQARAGWLLKKLDHFAEMNRRFPPRVLTLSELTQHKERAAELVTDSVQRFAPLLNVHPKKIAIANQKRRWGSCSARGDLRFNWRLAMMPAPIANYVVVHELAHMRVPNHSAKFWTTVQSILPDYKARRAWLRTNSLLFAVA